MKLFHTYVKLIVALYFFRAAAGLANLIPWLAEFPGDPLNCKKVISSTDKVFEYLENIIDEHVREFDENDIDDLTSAYIGEIKKLKSANQETTMNCKGLQIS